jgi:hypothetical protein
MKKIVFLFMLFLPLAYSCGSANRLANYVLTEQDASDAIRQLLQMGSREGSTGNAFSKQNIINTVFPEQVAKVLNTLNTLGLSQDLDRFTTTLSTAATTSVERSVPVFVNAIAGMRLGDAINLVKGGGTAATDYLKANTSTQLRTAITPVMQSALDEYKLNAMWNDLIKPVKSTSIGSRLNIDLNNLMALAVTNAMFKKMGEKELEIRSNSAARTTPLLQKVFGRSW